ncbi:MAG: mobilization protein [Eubacteriales bacterium]|nr:mobilization protein [Eubacteriales bacterium]
MMDKSLDNKGRWRNVIISFRMSPQERDDLNVRVKLSGLAKQDYIIKRLSERDIVVQPNTRVYKALRNQMAEILEELKQIDNVAGIDSDLLDIIQITVQTYNGLAEKEKS